MSLHQASIASRRKPKVLKFLAKTAISSLSVFPPTPFSNPLRTESAYQDVCLAIETAQYAIEEELATISGGGPNLSKMD
jgi:hypothetical protein